MSFDKKYLTMIYLRGQEEEATAGTDATVARSITRKPTLKDLIIFVTKPLADKLLCVQMVQSFYTYSVVYITDTCCKKLFKLKTGGQELQGVSCISSTLQRCELLIDKGAEMDTLHRGHALLFTNHIATLTCFAYAQCYRTMSFCCIETPSIFIRTLPPATIGGRGWSEPPSPANISQHGGVAEALNLYPAGILC
eukprot:Filipodium_phascolosomae@DN1892_c0_g1_i2.p1